MFLFGNEQDDGVDEDEDDDSLAGRRQRKAATRAATGPGRRLRCHEPADDDSDDFADDEGENRLSNHVPPLVSCSL